MDSTIHPVKSVLAIFTIFLFLVGFNAVIALDKGKVSYPAGYQDWKQVRSMVSFDEKHAFLNSSGGVHYVYVNSRGLKAYRNGRDFPDGAIIVFDLLEARTGQGTFVDGPGKFIGVMQKDSRKFKETGGWGFDAFEKDTKNAFVKDGGKGCFDCHSGQKQRDFVFSVYHS
jgi:hypothetical protein